MNKQHSNSAPRLLVPVELNALMLGKNANNTPWAAVTPQYDFIALLGITLGDKLLPQTFTPPPITPRPGVHLHWTIPDALTHGQQGQAGAKAVLDPQGRVQSLKLENGGFGYVAPPAISFDGGGGTGAAATATVTGGVVTDFAVTNPGAGYEAAPTVLIESSTEIRYPVVPNRWFILRSQVNNATRKVAMKSWIVESDALHLAAARKVIGRLPSHAGPLFSAKSVAGELGSMLAGIGLTLSGDTHLVESETPGTWFLLVDRNHLFTITQHDNEFVVSIDESVTWPTLKNPDTPYMYLGLAYDYVKGNDTPIKEYARDLTSIGPGDPQFAAFYPNCKSVFGFHDSLEDLPNGGRLTYMVAGYYADLTKDPLYGCDTEERWLQRMAEMEWCLAQNSGGYPTAAVCGVTGAAADSVAAGPPPFPTSILCHAMTYDLEWRGPNADYDSAVPKGQPKLAMGNTSVEALSALIGSMVAPPPGSIGVEQILEAFQYDLLDRLQEPDGVVKLEVALHQNAFGSHTGGTLWQVRGKHVDEHADDHPFDPEVSRLLTELNKLQQAYERKLADLQSLQWQTYSVWYKKILLNLSPFLTGTLPGLTRTLPGFRETPGNIMQNIYKLPEAMAKHQGTREKVPVTIPQIVEVLRRLEAQIAIEKTALADQRVKLDANRQDTLLAVAQKMPEYELVASAQPHYWSANDPAVLFAGEGIDRAFQRGESTLLADGKRLPCRVTGQTITGLTVAPAGHPDHTVTQAQLQQFYGGFPVGGPIPEAIQSLLIETLLLDTTMDRLIALAAYQLAGVPNPSEAQIVELAAKIKIIQTSPWNAVLYRTKCAQLPGFNTQRLAEAVGLQGTLPYKISVDKWSQPWIPLLLQWSVQWFPSYQLPSEVGFCKPDTADCGQKWIFNEVDFQWNTKFSPTGTPSANSVYGGTTLLTPHAPENLKARIEKYLHDHPDSPYKKVLSDIAVALGTANVLAQNLGGLGASLLQQLQTLQLPVIDLFDPKVGDQVAAAIDGNNEVATLPDAKYNPIRSGHFQIIRLWIVDSFGQAKKIVDEGLPYEPILAHTIATEGEQYKTLAQLPARVTQGSRLDFEFLSASNDTRPTNSDPATSPLCGWILPNYFDQSIAIYESDGKPAGSLQLLAGGLGKQGAGVRWVQPPGVNTPVGTPPALGNAHLQQFVTALLDYGAHGKNALAEFMRTLEDTQSTVAITGGRSEAGSPAVLFGRPMALVRASLKWSLEGLPGYDQSWAALKVLYDTRKFETRGFTDVQLPLRLGDIRRTNDGAIGYFLGTPESTDYKKFYATMLASTKSADSDYVEYARLIRLTCDPAAPPVMLTILADPRAPIHLTTDALPTQSIEIPPFNIQQALKAMDITFRAGPLLNDQVGVSFPLPSEVHGKWSWVYQPDVVTWKDVEKIEPSNAVADFPDNSRYLSEGWVKLSDALGDRALRDARGKKEEH